MVLVFPGREYDTGKPSLNWKSKQPGFKSGSFIYYSSFISQSLHFLIYKIRTIQPTSQSCYYNQMKYIKALSQSSKTKIIIVIPLSIFPSQEVYWLL